jgi:hypothetical protein
MAIHWRAVKISLRGTPPIFPAPSPAFRGCAYYSTCTVVADFVLVYTVLCRDVACRMECSRLRRLVSAPFYRLCLTIEGAIFPLTARRKEMSTICHCTKEKKRNTHLCVKEASWNIATFLSYLKSGGFPPPPPLWRPVLATQFGVSPCVKVAKSRRRAGGWVAG